MALNFLKSLLANPAADRAKLRPLWHAVNREARDPRWFATGGVADTISGRFDMVSAVLCQVLLRMEQDRDLVPASVILTEIFVEEMDGALRQSGVGDLMVGKQMGKLMATLGGRLGGFRDARGAVDRGAASQQVVERNIAFVDDGGDPQFVARTLLELADRLDTIDNRQLMAGDLG